MTKVEIREEIESHEHYAPRNIEGRLREWSRARWTYPVNPWPPESPMYAVLNSPGRATNVAGDGGLSSLCYRAGSALARDIRVREVAKAISDMPPHLRVTVIAMYDVPRNERPRSERLTAEKLEVTRDEAVKRLQRAYGWLERDLCLPQNLVSRAA